MDGAELPFWRQTRPGTRGAKMIRSPRRMTIAGQGRGSPMLWMHRSSYVSSKSRGRITRSTVPSLLVQGRVARKLDSSIDPYEVATFPPMGVLYSGRRWS